MSGEPLRGAVTWLIMGQLQRPNNGVLNNLSLLASSYDSAGLGGAMHDCADLVESMWHVGVTRQCHVGYLRRDARAFLVCGA